MKKYLVATAALALAGACTASLAQDGGGLFINAGVGQSKYHVGQAMPGVDAVDDADTAEALRLGYLWHGTADFGLEGGYADLGKRRMSSVGNAVLQDVTVHAKGWMLGAIGEFHFADRWFLCARGGWLRTSTDVTYRYADPVTSSSADGSADGDGWYGGVAVGYDVARHASLGLGYDNYHVKGRSGQVSADANVGSYMLTYEYRF